MEIAGYQGITLKDYPGKVAAVCFTQRCQLRCPYCHNPSLVLPDRFGRKEEVGRITGDFYRYLHKRSGLLDGVVLSGGEPLLQDGLVPVLQGIKAEGLAVKLDTNGMQPDYMEALIQHRLIDYVALDYKNCVEAWGVTVGITEPNSASTSYDSWLKSVAVLEEAGVEYELRTTVVRELHSHPHVRNMARELERLSIRTAVPWYWQSFCPRAPILSDFLPPPSGQRVLSAYSHEELAALRDRLQDITDRVSLRS